MASTLRVVKSSPVSSGPKPARKLGEHGAALWNSIITEYVIADSGGLEMLNQICSALDRAESLREQIDADGEMIISKKSGPREHPLLRHEIQARAFVCRSLHRLGLDVEAKKPIGRPPGSFKKG